MSKRILVTGASGCVGHYISELLIKETNHELFLLVRNPDKLKIDTSVRPNVTVLQGDMQEIGTFADLLKTIDVAVLTATAWGGDITFDVNVRKTLELMSLLDAQRCEQVIYFSTASVLDSNDRPLKEAGEIGTDYIRSKYDCLQKKNQLAIASKITTVFPTLVLGGDANKPYSHLTTGIPEVTKYVDIIRFLKADGSFHFIHAKDIATVVKYLIETPTGKPRQYVLGQNKITANEAIEEVCGYLGRKISFRIPLSFGLANAIIVIFRIQMAAWDRFCMEYRHFTYKNAINPATFGLPNYCPTMSDVLKLSGVEKNWVMKLVVRVINSDGLINILISPKSSSMYSVPLWFVFLFHQNFWHGLLVVYVISFDLFERARIRVSLRNPDSLNPSKLLAWTTSTLYHKF